MKRLQRGMILGGVVWVVASWSVSAALAAGGGTITGTVKLTGTAAGARLEDVIVSVEGLHYPAVDGKVPAPADLAFDQKDLTFVPHVLPVPAGIPITLHNGDAVLHNVHADPKINPPFNLGMMKGSKKTVTLEKPEIVHVRCDVHSEMSAFILVKDNPFYARPGKDGRFAITGIPAGTYTLEAWQEKAGSFDQPVTIADGGTLTVDFTVGK